MGRRSRCWCRIARYETDRLGWGGGPARAFLPSGLSGAGLPSRLRHRGPVVSLRRIVATVSCGTHTCRRRHSMKLAALSILGLALAAPTARAQNHGHQHEREQQEHRAEPRSAKSLRPTRTGRQPRPHQVTSDESCATAMEDDQGHQGPPDGLSLPARIVPARPRRRRAATRPPLDPSPDDQVPARRVTLPRTLASVTDSRRSAPGSRCLRRHASSKTLDTFRHRVRIPVSTFQLLDDVFGSWRPPSGPRSVGKPQGGTWCRALRRISSCRPRPAQSAWNGTLLPPSGPRALRPLSRSTRRDRAGPAFPAPRRPRSSCRRSAVPTCSPSAQITVTRGLSGEDR